MAELSNETQKKMMRQLLLARNFEEKVNEMFMQGRIHGTTHLGVGQEGCAVGAINALQTDDYIISNHRGHSHCLTRGANLNRMMSELFGKADGFCKGKGGSMHIVDVETKNLGANGIVGGGFPISVGVALALKKRKTNQVIVNFFGDGSTNEGAFHEAVNIASIWKLPIVFVCENNLYGMSTPISKVMAVENVADRASAYNIPAYIEDGNDVFKVYDVVKKAVEYARNGNGPVFIELKTYRWTGHSKSDPKAYRTKEEEKEWKKKCPVKRFKEHLNSSDIMTEDEINNIETEVRKELEDAVKYAEACSYPSFKDMLGEVYA